MCLGIYEMTYQNPEGCCCFFLSQRIFVLSVVFSLTRSELLRLFLSGWRS